MKESLLTLLENSRNYTLAVSEAMPGEIYDFKPSTNVWSFKEQLHHIAYGIQWWEENYVKGNKTGWNPTPTKNNRDEVVKYLNQSYDSLKDTVVKAKLGDEIMKGFYATLDHITHHRGQAIVYLRCNSIPAPEYNY